LDTQNYKDLESRITKLEEKVTYMTQLLEQQHSLLFPGVGKRLVNWALQHWLLLIFILFASYSIYEILGFIDMLNSEIEAVQQRLEDLIESAKFWK